MVIHFASCYIRGNITVNNHREWAAGRQGTRSQWPIIREFRLLVHSNVSPLLVYSKDPMGELSSVHIWMDIYCCFNPRKRIEYGPHSPKDFWHLFPAVSFSGNYIFKIQWQKEPLHQESGIPTGTRNLIGKIQQFRNFQQFPIFQFWFRIIANSKADILHFM